MNLRKLFEVLQRIERESRHGLAEMSYDEFEAKVQLYSMRDETTTEDALRKKVG